MCRVGNFVSTQLILDITRVQAFVTKVGSFHIAWRSRRVRIANSKLNTPTLTIDDKAAKMRL